MYKCLDCGFEFEEPQKYAEDCTPGTPNCEKSFINYFEGCPICAGAYEEYEESEEELTMEDLEKQVLDYLNDRYNRDYYYKGILWETFCEYRFRHENYEDFKEDIPVQLLTFENIEDIATYICNNAYITMQLHDIMCNQFMNYKESEEE